MNEIKILLCYEYPHETQDQRNILQISVTNRIHVDNANIRNELNEEDLHSYDKSDDESIVRDKKDKMDIMSRKKDDKINENDYVNTDNSSIKNNNE